MSEEELDTPREKEESLRLLSGRANRSDKNIVNYWTRAQLRFLVKSKVETLSALFVPLAGAKN